MNHALQIAVDLEQGEIRLGSESVRLLPVAGDVFCLNDARGPLVRALKFEERARLVSDAGDRDVASLVADASLVSAGVSPDEIRIAASLALAGGGEEAPGFPECVQFVEQRYGWDEKRIGESMALVIDRLCGQMVQQDSNGWKQIVFQKSEADLGALISQMATNLSQRAGTVSESKNNSESSTNKQKIQPTSPQPSRSTNGDGFESQFSSSSSHGSTQSVSSASPVKRSPFRVLAVNTDKTEFETPAIAASEPNEVLAAAPTRSKLVPPSTTIAPPSLKEDFPAALKPQSNRVNFSLSQAAAAPAKIEQPLSQPLASFPSSQPSSQPLASFPSWQPLATRSSNAQSSSEPVRMSSRSFPATQTTTQTTPEFTNDWLAEVAQLLEAECDMRGIDP